MQRYRVQTMHLVLFTMVCLAALLASAAPASAAPRSATPLSDTDVAGTPSPHVQSTDSIFAVPYNISGRVVDGNGNPLSGVLVEIATGGIVFSSDTTLSNGGYGFLGLDAGTYVLTPKQSGKTFTPSSRILAVPPDRENADFVVNTPPPPETYNISGYILDDSSNPMGGLLVEIATGGIVFSNDITRPNGAYGFLGLDAGTYVLTPRQSGKTFTPSSRILAVPPDRENADFVVNTPPPPETYNISGYILDDSGNPVDGLLVEIATGGIVFSDDITRPNGGYGFLGLDAGTYVLTPKSEGVVFTPTSRIVRVPPDAENMNFTVPSRIPQAEYDALVALYRSTEGSTWFHRDGWLTDTDPCWWYGVTCSSGHVISIELPSNRLGGSIPSELGSLTNLQTLDLRDNRLTGNIPPELGSLTKLQSLYLFDNQLTGSIPPALGSLTNLHNLYLRSNQLTGSIPQELGSLTNLQYLDLSYNPLTGSIPPALGSLTNLQGLILLDNQLIGSIPPALGNLTNLQELWLSGNQLTGSIPPALGNLTNLQVIFLSSNQLAGSILPALGNLANLQWLNLSGNQLTGSIPPALGNLTNLQHLYLNSNQLTGSIPPALGSLTNLQTLTLYNNQLTGSIPPELGSLTNLQTLSLGNSQLTGSIPPALGNLTNLKHLYLSGNQLTGSIPPALGSLSNLQYLELGNNQLTGSIPPALGNLTNLQGIYLFDNQLTGNIPPALGNLTNLHSLYLDSNQLNGAIPLELTALTDLFQFYFDGTQLCEPDQQSFRDWLATIQYVQSTGKICGTTSNISGRILDSSSNPLSGVLVEIATGGIVFSDYTTGSNGEYGFLGLDAGTYTLTPKKTGVTFSPASHTITVPPDGENLNFTGTDHFSISGQLIDQAGQPIVGATVAVATGGIVVAEPTTGSDGGYIAENLPAGSYTVTPAKPGQAFAPASRTIAVPPSALGVNFTGQRNRFTIGGRVVDGAGQPVSGVRVEISAGGIVVAEPTTDVNGFYTALDLMENTYSVTPVKTGFAFNPPSRTATVPPDASGVDFIGTDRFSISGQLVDQAGQPIVGATVAIATGGIVIAEPTTGSDGGYIAENLSAGSYTVTPAKPGQAFAPASRTIAVPPSALGVNFTGQRNRFTIGGHVVDDAGQPVSGVRVEIATGGIVVAEPTTDVNGFYTALDLMENTYSVTPILAGFTFTPAAAPVTTPPDQSGINFIGFVSTAVRVNVWLTTPDRRALLAPQSATPLLPDAASQLPVIDVDAATVYQPIDGFGAAATESAAQLLWLKLPAAQRATVLRQLFDPNDGIGLSVVRVPMGASDFALSSYTYGEGCGSDTSFECRDKDDVIPLLQAALRINPNLKVIASPWTAPPRMKTNNSYNDGRLKPEFYREYAKYFVNFVQAYSAHGIPIYAVTVQNEPEPREDWSPSYPSMRFSREEMAVFVGRYLGPAFADNGITTKIIVWDHNWNTPGYPIDVLNDRAANGYTAGSAFHCYESGEAVDRQHEVHDAHPNKEVYFTECTGLISDQFGSSLDWITRLLTVGSVRNWSRTVQRWNLALNQNQGPQNGGCTDCRGLLTIVDTGDSQAQKEVIFEVDYYALGHASKFVRPGAFRIESSSRADLPNVAFRNADGSNVLVVLNHSSVEQSFKVRSGSKMFFYALPAGAVATFVWQGDNTVSPRFSITGRVVGQNGQPVANVAVTLRQNGTTAGATSTDSQGRYIFNNLASDTYTVHPAGANLGFVPAQAVVALPPVGENVDFVAQFYGQLQPNPGGYSFSNGRRYTDWAIFRSTFGADAVERMVGGGLEPRPQAEAYYHMSYICDAEGATCKEVGMEGNCSGMAASSVLLRKGWATPADFLASQSAQTSYDLNLQKTDSGLWAVNAVSDFLVRYQGYQYGLQVQQAQAAVRGRSLAEDGALIRQSIDAGLVEPVIVGIRDVVDRPGQLPFCVGHALTPYAYYIQGGETRVKVYDPNQPGSREQVLVLSEAANQWRYNNDNSLGVWESQGNSCAGDTLVVLPVSAWRNQPLAPWADDITRRQARTDDLVMIQAGAVGTLLITDAQGRRIGWVDNEQVAEIPDAFWDISDTANPESTSPPPDRFVFRSLQATGPLTIAVTGGSSPSSVLGIFSANGVVMLTTQHDAVRSGPGESAGSDGLSISPDLGQIVLKPGMPGTQSVSVIKNTGDADRTVEVAASLNGGEQMRISPAQDLANFAVQTSTQSDGYRIRLDQVGETPIEFAATVQANSAEEVTTIIFDWTQDDVAQIQVDQNADGAPDYSETLQNELGSALYLPVIAR